MLLLKYNRVYCLLSTVLLTIAFHSAKSQTYKPINISLSQGLAQSSVYEIVQDKQGFIWMATQDGLCRYDGLQFKIYREDPFDTTTLTTNYINTLLVDKNGWLWAGTLDYGINLFVPSSSQFRHFFISDKNDIGHNSINDIYQDRSGTIWAATSKGIIKFVIEGDDPATAKVSLQTIKLKETKPEEPQPAVNRIYADRKNNLWVGTRKGLYRLELKDSEISKTDFYSCENGSGISNNNIQSFCEDDNGRLWIGTAGGLTTYIHSSKKFIDLFNEEKELADLLKSKFISELTSDSKGNLWVGTDGGGLFLLKKENLNDDHLSGKFNYVQIGNERLTTSIFSIYEDQINPGLMWIGTFAGGSYKLVPVLKNFYSDHLEHPGIKNPVVRSIMKDYSGTVWIGTQNGLIRQNKIKNTYDAFYSGEKYNSLNGDYISALFQDKEKNIWIGTDYGIQRIENPYAPNPQFKSWFLDKEHSKKFIRAFCSDNNENLFAVLRNSIFLFNYKTKSFEIFFENNDSLLSKQREYYISSVLIDHQNNCWIGSSMGLFIYRKGSNLLFDWSKPEIYYHNLKDTNTLRSQNIQSMIEDSKGNVWLSTQNGLTKANIINGKVHFTNYSTENNIKNNTVYGAIEDQATGLIWLSTNGGLTRFDPSFDGKTTVNFDINDGLQSNEFNGGAFSRSSDGEFFFGGIQGYTSFYPAQIKLDTVSPKVLITDFVISGKVLSTINDAAGNKNIKLKYFENSFTVDFIALHYHEPAKNQYAYKLEGFQQDWTNCGNSHQVNFSQLPAGKYIFKVIASNSDGYFNPQGDALTIIITPPFYQTIWFYLALLGFIAIVLWLLHIYRLQMKLAQVKEVERIRKETAADFHDELGHRLTTISWFSEILKKKIKPEQTELKSYLDKIIEASGNLYLTMKDLLWAMDPEKDSLYHMYIQLKNFGEELFDHTGIEFNANDVQEELKNFDLPLSYKRHILLIFKEIMHNSLKHAIPVSTFLDLEKNNGTLTFRFGDNGKGFDTSNGSLNGNGIKNVKRRAEIIHADISLRSNGTGTIFELKMSLN